MEKIRKVDIPNVREDVGGWFRVYHSIDLGVIKWLSKLCLWVLYMQILPIFRQKSLLQVPLVYLIQHVQTGISDMTL